MNLDSYLLVDKPSGLSTHSPDVGIPGFAEHLSYKLGIKLWVCHRLDKETSGAIIFAKSKEAAALLGNAFESSNVKKRYVFVTDRAPDIASTHRIESKIEKRGERFESILGGSDSNACTRFVRLSTKGKYSLWDAFPETGKPHQIRLHARDLGFPILRCSYFYK